jgi:hypothetical protein
VITDKLIGKKIRRVVYYFWHNVNSGENTSLDWVELTDHDKNILTLQRGENDDSIVAVDFDLEKEKMKLREQFNGSITIERYNATLDKFWFPILDDKIKAVKSSSESIIIDFGNDHQVEIAMAEDGLEIEFYE